MTCAPDEVAHLLATAAAWAPAGAALATVLTTWGSAPRGAGSQLVVRADGAFEGSVSGGCVEGEVVVEALDVIATGTARLLRFGVADETAWRVGLGCGGSIAVLVQPVADGGFPPALLASVAAARARGAPSEVTLDERGDPARAGAHPGAGRHVVRYDPPRRLAVVGAVHVAQALAPLARALGLAVTIIDPRTAFATDERFAGEALDRRWPDEALADFRADPASAVVCLTHDPKLDDPALVAALASPAFYVAALGSRANHARRLDRLRVAGVAEAELARVRGPAGLPIGARGPAEIALAVAAELTAVWRGAGAPAWPTKP